MSLCYKSNPDLPYEIERRWISNSVPKELINPNEVQFYLTKIIKLSSNSYRRYRFCYDLGICNLVIKSGSGIKRGYYKKFISKDKYDSVEALEVGMIGGQFIANNRIFDWKILNTGKNLDDTYFILETEFRTIEEADNFQLSKYINHDFKEVTDNPSFEFNNLYFNLYSKDPELQSEDEQWRHFAMIGDYNA